MMSAALRFQVKFETRLIFSIIQCSIQTFWYCLKGAGTQKKACSIFVTRMFYEKTNLNSPQIIQKKSFQKTQICFPKNMEYGNFWVRFIFLKKMTIIDADKFFIQKKSLELVK